VIEPPRSAEEGRSPWERAVVTDIRPETSSATTFRLALDRPSGHRAGQHYVVRLTAPDGYRAMRSYSVASAPDGSNEFELTVELLPDGEVSGFLHDVVEVSDELEVRGPIGGWFVWDGASPATLVGGGSGVVPLMSMLRLARRLGRSDLVRLLVSVRSPADLYYSDEIGGPESTIVYTREVPATAARPAGRLERGDVAPLVRPDATAYVCGSTGFTNAASDRLLEAGVATDRIRVERFGPTG
jgi:ferredoxin-NADP reductase